MNEDAFYYVKLTSGQNFIINDYQLQEIMTAIQNKESHVIIKKNFKLINVREIVMIEKKEETDKILKSLYGGNTYPRKNNDSLRPIEFNS